MAVRKNECPNCGANIKSEGRGPHVCEYCKTTVVLENENGSSSKKTIGSVIDESIKGIKEVFTQKKSEKPIPPRPKTNYGTFWCLFFTTFFVGGFIYLSCRSSAKKKWDKKYMNKENSTI